MGVIEAVGVTKRYRSGGAERVVLDDVSLSVPTGRLLSVMGPSGSGKSTLLHILGGIDRSHDGSVIVGGVTIGDCDDDALSAVRRRSIGFVFQAFNLVPVLTALENVTLPGVIDGRSGSVCEARAFELLDRFGMVDRATQRPAELSGGEQQRVAIARALFLEPEVLLADEPTGNLDSASGSEVVDVLTSVNSDFGCTVVLVTHDPVVAAVADEVLVLSDGRLGEPLRFGADDQPEGRQRQLVSWLAGAASSQPERRGRPLAAR